jgi:predicted RNase H-like HicB family nuclease
MEKVLVNSDEYNGQYVAMVSAEDTIVGSGSTPEEALNEARKEGIQTPFLLSKSTYSFVGK